MSTAAFRLFLDSAERAEVEPLLRTGLFAGVTTNPTLLDAAGARRDDIPRIAEWAGAETREVAFQVWGATADDMLASARWIREQVPTALVKVPVTEAGAQVVAALHRDGVPVLLTAVYSARQAVLASALGVRYLAPYVNRMSRLGVDAVAEVGRMCSLLPQDGSGPRVMAASVKTAGDVLALAAVGVRTFTLAPAVARELLADEHTTGAVADFEAAMARVGAR